MLWGAGRALIATLARRTRSRPPSVVRTSPASRWLVLPAIAASTAVLVVWTGTAGGDRPVRQSDWDGPYRLGNQTRASSRVPVLPSIVSSSTVPARAATDVEHFHRGDGRRSALIVGINHARGGRTLPGSVTDAENLRDALFMYGFKRSNVHMLLEGAATRDAILRELDVLAERTPRDGLAVFGIATHTRRRGAQNELLTADGLRISATELAAKLGRVRGRMWITLPTCYAGGYARPGIVGPDRVVTFASSSGEPTYQIGSSGSYLMLYMVKKAMLGRRSPASVESAFAWARAAIEHDAPNRVPSISDGYTGDLELGPPPPQRSPSGASAPRSETRRSSPQRRDGSASESPPPHRRGSQGPGVCGRYSVHCRR